MSSSEASRRFAPRARSAVGYYDPHSTRSQLSTDLTTERLHNRVPVWARAFVALGRRSTSGYIAQSFIFLVLPDG